MKKLLNVVLFFVAVNFTLQCSATAENVCGDWVTYKEEKCIKVIDSSETQPFEKAVQTCTAHDASKLITISNADEQTFLADLLFTKKHLVDNVWLGAKIVPKQGFHWDNGEGVTFTNWALGNPKNHSTESCVQMHAEEEVRGKWSNEPCTKKNLVVCEKAQSWSFGKMQETIVKMIKNPIPVGFIYVQLPQEKSPQEIWPSLIFTDVSHIYEGVFFRVAGKGAAAFGAVQEEFSPYIDEVQYDNCIITPVNRCANQFNSFWSDKISRSGGWTKHIITANYFSNSASAERWVATHRFHTVPGEVRPRNMAIKVWKRTG